MSKGYILPIDALNSLKIEYQLKACYANHTMYLEMVCCCVAVITLTLKRRTENVQGEKPTEIKRTQQ